MILYIKIGLEYTQKKESTKMLNSSVYDEYIHIFF